MTRDEVYEQWKRQRASIDVGEDFAAAVTAGADAAATVAETVAETDETADDNDRAIVYSRHRHRSWRSRLIGTTAIVAASVLGMVRVAMAFFIGVEAG